MIYQAKYDDLIDLLCAEKIGEGISRTVFECRINPEWVVKVENDKTDNFQNVMEWKIWWDASEFKAVSKWLAPCKYMSDTGLILIQQKTEPIRKSDIPVKIPHFFTDQKIENYGIYNGQFVCHDYGSIILTNGMTQRMKKSQF